MVTINWKNPVFLGALYAVIAALLNYFVPLAQSSVAAGIIVFILNYIDAHLTGVVQAPIIAKPPMKFPVPPAPTNLPTYDTNIYGVIMGHGVVVDVPNVSSLTMGDGSIIHNAPLGSTAFKTDKGWYGDVTPAGITFSKINFLLNDSYYTA